MATAIALENVNKAYGPVKALDNFTLSIDECTIFGLLGPNGAGKTTCVSICTTLLTPDSGVVFLGGKPATSTSKAVRQQIALMPQGKALDPMLNVEDNLRYYGKLAGCDSATIAERIVKVTKIFELEPFLQKNVFALSGGQFRRAQLARTFIAQPRYLFLDEPTLGIDIQGKMSIWKAVREFVQSTGCTILLTSNDMTEIEKTCDRVGFLNRGKLLFSGTFSDIALDADIRLQCKFKRPVSNKLPTPPQNVHIDVFDAITVTLTFPDYGPNLLAYLSTLADLYGLDSLRQQTTDLTDLFTRYTERVPS